MWATEFCGGCRRQYEIQTWNGKMDISDLTSDEMTEADVDHIDLNTKTDLIDNGILDVHVNGYLRPLDPEGQKLGCFDLKIQEGRPVSVRASSESHWLDWEYPQR